LRFAVSVSAHGFNLHTVGVILIVIGLLGLVISLLWMKVWADRQRGVATVSRQEVPVRDAKPVLSAATAPIGYGLIPAGRSSPSRQVRRDAMPSLTRAYPSRPFEG
jgi:hypothetical protein